MYVSIEQLELISKGPKMHEIYCGSVNTTGISVAMSSSSRSEMVQAVSLSVVRRTELEQVVYVSI